MQATSIERPSVGAHFKSSFNRFSSVEWRALRNAFITVTVLCVITWLISPPHFTETSDDAIMQSFAEGYDGNYAAHLLYINIILGAGIKLLNTYLPGIPWYTLTQIALCYCSMVVLTFLVLLRARGPWQALAASLLLSPFFYETLCKMQFSKTSGVAVVAGFMLLAWAIQTNKRFTLRLLAGMLVFLGSLYRILIFEMLFVPFFGLFAYIVWDSWDGGSRVVARRVAVSLVLIVATCMGGRVLHKAVYASDPQWRLTQDINVGRAELIDQGFPDYEENVDVYESLGLTRNDYNLFRLAAYGDPELFTPTTIEALTGAKESQVSPEEFLEDYLKDLHALVLGLLKYKYTPVVILVFFFGLISNWGNTKQRTLLLYEIAAVLLVQLYFCFINRYLQNRVDVCYALALFCIAHYATVRYPRIDVKREYVMALAVSVAVFHSPVFFASVKSYSNVSKTTIPRLFNYLEHDDEHLYLYVYSWSKLPNKIYNAFDSSSRSWSTNSVALGTWRYYTPVTENVLKTWGIKNPYRDIVDNPDVYLLTGGNVGLDQVSQHIQEHYDIDARAYKVKDLFGGRYRAYRISTEEELVSKREKRRAVDVSKDPSVNVSPPLLQRGVNGKLCVTGEIYIEGCNALQYDVIVEYVDVHKKSRYTYATNLVPRDEEEFLNGESGKYEVAVAGNVSEQINLYVRTPDELLYLGTLDAERDVKALPVQ